MILGYVPLILIITNFLIAYGNASYSGWLLYKMPYAVIKMTLFSLVGAVAAMYLPSRLSALSQISAMQTRIHLYGKTADVPKDMLQWMSSKMSGAWWKNLFLAIIAILTAVLVHATLIFLMVVAFSDPLLMKNLGIQGGEASYIALGIGMECVSIFVDMLLGLTTNVRVDVKTFFPDFEEIYELLGRKDEYNKFQKNMGMLTSNKGGSGGSGGSGSGKGSSGGGNQGGNKGGGKNPPKNKPVFNQPAVPPQKIPTGVPTHEVMTMVLSNTTFEESQFLSYLGKVSTTQRRTKITNRLSGLMKHLRNMYQAAANETDWAVNGGTHWKKIKGELNKLVNILGSIGYHIHEK